MSLSVCVRWTAFENMIDDTSSVQMRLHIEMRGEQTILAVKARKLLSLT